MRGMRWTTFAGDVALRCKCLTSRYLVTWLVLLRYEAATSDRVTVRGRDLTGHFSGKTGDRGAVDECFGNSLKGAGYRTRLAGLNGGAFGVMRV